MKQGTLDGFFRMFVDEREASGGKTLGPWEQNGATVRTLGDKVYVQNMPMTTTEKIFLGTLALGVVGGGTGQAVKGNT